MAKRVENLKKYETTIRSRVECDERAFHIVNNLIDGTVDGPYLIKCGQMMSREHYNDVVEERAISYLCGYPLCDKALANIPKKQYQISTITNKVYDISERKNFCSNQCLKASKHFSNQIPESPLWTRAKEAPADIKLLSHTEIRGMVGNEVVGILPQKLLEEEIKKLEELDLRSSSKKETLPSKKKKVQTTTVKKGTQATRKDEKNDASIKGSKNEDIVLRNLPEHSDSVLNNETLADMKTTLGSEASVTGDEINSPSIDINKQLEGMSLSDQQGHLKSKQEESFVKHCNNVTVDADCEKLSKGSLETETPEALFNENVDKDSSRFDDKSDQTTKMDYLMKLLSKRKNVLSGMIDVMTVVSNGDSQPIQKTSPTTENMDVVPSAKDTNEYSSGQPSSGEHSWQASVNQVNINQNPSHNSAAKVSTSNFKSTSNKKNSRKSPLQRLGAVIKTWVTKETTAYIQSSSVSGSNEGSMRFSDPRIQRGYASLCQRLDAQQKDFVDLISDTEDGADNSSRSFKSVPDYSTLQEKADFQLKVTEVPTGRKPETVQKKGDSEEDSVYLPTIDAYNQQQIRVKIVLNRLEKFLPDLLVPLHLTVQDVSSLVRELAYTFRFDKDNIVFKPSEWILVAILILKMLGKKNRSIGAAFTGESAVRHFNILFQGIGVTVTDFDVVTEDILLS